MPAVAFTIRDRRNTAIYPMTGYALPFEIFKFVADFTTVPNSISDRKVIWNFGDGNISTSLTGSHFYAYPGIYPINLTVFDSDGNSSISTVVSTIRIANYINDAIILTTNGELVENSGSISKPVFITRYNSWQTSLSGENNIISLAVSGNKSPFFEAQEYNTNPYAHLYPASKFILSGKNGITVVDSVTTTNTPIYASLSSGEIITRTLTGNNSYIAGSSGTAVFYYVEDYGIPRPTITPSPTIV